MDVKLARRSGLKKVGEVADIFGTTPRTILYYEEQGIISPMKTSRGTRMYSAADIKRFEVAYKMSCLGVPLKTVRDLASIRPSAATGREAGRKLCSILDELINDIQRQIHHMEFIRQDLERGRLMLRMCGDCPNKPGRMTCPKCPCETQMDQSQLMWLTWDPDRGTIPPSTADEPATQSVETSFKNLTGNLPAQPEPEIVKTQPRKRPRRRGAMRKKRL